MELLTMRTSGSLIPLPAFGTVLLLLGCHVQLWYSSFTFYFVMFHCYLLEANSFLRRVQKGGTSWEEWRWGAIGKSRGKENWNEDLLDDKKNLFSIKGGIDKMKEKNLEELTKTYWAKQSFIILMWRKMRGKLCR